MNRKEKAELIKKHVIAMLNESVEAITKEGGLIDKSLNCGAVDIEEWDENINPMILPKTIITAILERESKQFLPTGTSFEKEMKKDIKNLGYFI